MNRFFTHQADVLSEKTAREQLQKEGFTQIYVRNEGPDFEYKDHSHPVPMAHIIISGSMTIWEDGKPKEVKAGDRLDFTAQVIRHVKAGPEGCKYVTGILV